MISDHQDPALIQPGVSVHGSLQESQPFHESHEQTKSPANGASYPKGRRILIRTAHPYDGKHHKSQYQGTNAEYYKAAGGGPEAPAVSGSMADFFNRSHRCLRVINVTSAVSVKNHLRKVRAGISVQRDGFEAWLL